MTDRLQALIELRERVKEGDFSGPPYLVGRGADHKSKALMIKSGLMEYASKIGHAHNGSLDAALEIHNAVLPGWEYGYDGSIAWVKIKGLRTSYRHDAGNGYTSRAWLIAILSALIAMEGAEDE